MGLRILFLNGQPFLPQIVGGVEVSTLQLCHVLRELGHEPFIMASLERGDALWLRNAMMRRLTGFPCPSDRYHGIPVFRGWNMPQGLTAVIERIRPDAVVLQTVNPGPDFTAVCARAIELGTPTFAYVRAVSTIMRLRTHRLPDALNFIGNSSFTAGVIRRELGRDAGIVPPLIDARRYAGESSREFVTMINPRPLKGGDIALALAQSCPDIPFLFVEAWGRDDPEVARIRQAASRLSNVEWLRPQRDMQAVYGRTKILLVPSRCEETWGRVVSEGHFLGIPALASRIGALPETVGPGGILVSPDAGAPAWTQALRGLWDDAAAYAEIAAAAQHFSAREEIEWRHVAGRFVACLQAAIRQPAEDRLTASRRRSATETALPH